MHVHVGSPDGEAKFWLEPRLSLATHTGLSPQWRSIMAKSSARGARTSVEVLGLTPHALWLMVGRRELMLDFSRFPWFSQASLEDVFVRLTGRHLRED